MQNREPPTSDHRYRQLVDAITDYAIYMLDVEGRVTSWNSGAERFKGYKPSEIIGRHFSTFYTDEEQLAGVPAEALRTAANDGRFEREGWRIRKDGSRFWAHVIIDPIRDPDGELVGYAKVTRDLTERRAAEERLRRSEEQFRILVQSVTDYAIYMLDGLGHVTSWNAGAQRIKGYSADEVIGRHFSSFYTDKDRNAGLPCSGLAQAAEHGCWETEGWRLRKDGSCFWAHVVINAIYDDGGAVIGFAKITRDITERIEAQRTLDEAREALFQAQKLEAVGQLTGGVAHDFNNLLMAIQGSIELARKRAPADSGLLRLLDNAMEGVRRGAGLTQRMLAFARKQDLRVEAVDLLALVRGMQPFVQRSIGPEIRVSIRIPSNLPLVRTDPNQLEAALLNLVVNARDAMPDGGAIVISARRLPALTSVGPPVQAGDYVCLTVVDTGLGMNEETIAKATEPFFTTKGVGKGTGLGLSMVHGLVSQSGGSMRIDSTLGEGTCIELLLPTANLSDAAITPAPQWPADTPPESGQLVILAIDDDPLVLANTAALLEDLGHTVLTATSGAEALTIWRHAGIDLVITDQAMPGMTGVRLAEDLWSVQPSLPVIVATGYAELPDGLDPRLHRLAKPFTQGELVAAINAAMVERATVY
ncbi:MAG: PAS domain S-box protein [Pseudomonadota bacterium]